MESSTGFSIILLALAGMMILSKGEQDSWRAQSFKMNETWPFMVFSSTVCKDKLIICDGIIYNQKWLVFSSTCATKITTMFYFGFGNRFCHSGTNVSFPYANQVQVRKFKRYIWAPQDWSTPWWVIVLVEVSPLLFNDNVKPAKLAEEPPLEGQKFDSPGWVESDDVADNYCYERYKVSVTMSSEAQCIEAWGKRGNNFTMGEIICFGPPRKCSTYDEFINNGAPLVKDGTVYGLAVLEESCYRSKNALSELGKVLSIAPYIPWLKDVTDEDLYPVLNKLLRNPTMCPPKTNISDPIMEKKEDGHPRNVGKLYL